MERAILFGVEQGENGRPSRHPAPGTSPRGASARSRGEGVEMLLYSHPDHARSSRFTVIARSARSNAAPVPLARAPQRRSREFFPASSPCFVGARDGASLRVYMPGAFPARGSTAIRLSDGHREKWKELVPGDAAGVTQRSSGRH